MRLATRSPSYNKNTREQKMEKKNGNVFQALSYVSIVENKYNKIKGEHWWVFLNLAWEKHSSLLFRFGKIHVVKSPLSCLYFEKRDLKNNIALLENNFKIIISKSISKSMEIERNLQKKNNFNT